MRRLTEDKSNYQAGYHEETRKEMGANKEGNFQKEHVQTAKQRHSHEHTETHTYTHTGCSEQVLKYPSDYRRVIEIVSDAGGGCTA